MQNQNWILEPSGFRTRIFRIRFCLEEVDISETFILQLFVSNSLEALSAMSCIVECELLYQEADLANPNSIPSHFNLKPVCKELVRIDRMSTCAHSHYGCTFTADYFCLVNMAVVTALQGYTTQEALNA